MNQGQLIRYVLWLAGDDTGSSSKAIWCHMTGIDMRETSTPADDADFGRCFRLLALFPEWRPRIAEMAKVSPRWGALAHRWDTLETLYLGGWGRMVCRLIYNAADLGAWWGDQAPEQGRDVRVFDDKPHEFGRCSRCNASALTAEIDGEWFCETCHDEELP